MEEENENNNCPVLSALQVCHEYNDGSITEAQYLLLLRLACARSNAIGINTVEKEELPKKVEDKKRIWDKRQ